MTPFAMLAATVRWLRSWRTELIGLAAVVLVVTGGDSAIGTAPTHLFVVAAIVAALTIPTSRARVTAWLGRQGRRRTWTQALAGVIPLPATPTVLSYRDTPAGSEVQIRTGPGGNVTELADRVEHLAAWLDVHEVRVERRPARAGHATLRALRVDPLEAEAGPWPWLTAPRTALWRPVPVGIDEAGHPVGIDLAGHNLLVGGEPGAGKSVAVSQVIAAAALDPAAGLWLLDGKLVELAAWTAAASGTAGVAIGEAIELLAHLQTVMDARYRQLLDEHRRKVAPDTGLHVMVVDELAHYCTWPDRKPRDAFTDLLRDLVSRGRAAGIVVIAATQKPGSDIIPTSLRDLFGYRWALRCTTPAASDTILGTGWATNGISASTISSQQRGVGWLLHESGEPVRLRAHHLSDATVAVLAARACGLRQGASQ